MPLSFQDMPQSLRDEFTAHYIEAYPKEAVGLITDKGEVVRLKNWSRRTDRFLVGYWAIFRRFGWKGLIKGQGINVIYHSHRIEAFPSPWDQELMLKMEQRWPHVAWLIYVPGTEFMMWEYDH